MAIKNKKAKNTGMLIAFLGISVAAGEMNPSLHADFIRTKTQKYGTETVKGTLCQSGGRIIIKVSEPIAQFMLIDSGSTLIYYPDKHSALRLRQKNPAVLPLFQTFLGFFQNSQIVPPPGFRIGTTEKNGDSIRTTWIPESKKTTFRGRYETVFCSDKLVRAFMYDKRSNLIALQQFSKDSLLHGRHVPLQISSITLQDSDTVSESLLFSNLSIGTTVPDEILQLEIPADVPIKVFEW